MNKSKLVGFLFVILGVLVIIGAAYAIISYAQETLSAMVDFVTTNNFTKLQDCGVEPSPQLQRLKADFATVILPSLYIGLPLLLIVLSFLMFLGGFYYHRGKYQDELEKSKQMEKEMLRRAVEKLHSEKKPGKGTKEEELEEQPE